MATFPTTGIVRAVMPMQLGGGQDAFNVFHFGKGSAFTQGEVNDCAADLGTLYLGSNPTQGLNDFLSDVVSIGPAYARTLDPANPLEATDSVTGAGQLGDEPVPLESCIVTTFYTGTANRRGRGRTYLGGSSSTNIDDGTLRAITQGLLAGIYQAWIDNVIATEGFDPVVYSPTDGVGRTIESVNTRRIIHHQRRRNQ